MGNDRASTNHAQHNFPGKSPRRRSWSPYQGHISVVELTGIGANIWFRRHGMMPLIYFLTAFIALVLLVWILAFRCGERASLLLVPAHVQQLLSGRVFRGEAVFYIGFKESEIPLSMPLV